MSLNDRRGLDQSQDERRSSGSRPMRVEFPHIFAAEIQQHLMRLTKKDNWHGILAVLETYSIIAIAIGAGLVLPSYTPWFVDGVIYLCVWIVIGTRQRGLATLLHEASHRAMARNRLLNNALGTVFSGWLIFQIGRTYFNSHVLGHHRNTGDGREDPDTFQYVLQKLLTQNPDNFVARNILSMALGAKTVVNLPYLIRDRLIPDNWSEVSAAHKWEIAGFIAFWAALLSGLLYFGWFDEFAFFWLLPFLTTFQAANWLIETSEHFPLAWFHNKAVFATRNRDGNAFERFLTGVHGENWHLVHHLRPGIPFWNQRKAHEIMLADPEYASSTARYAGLFTRGSASKPTIMKAMAEELRQAQLEHHQEIKQAA